MANPFMILRLKYIGSIGLLILGGSIWGVAPGTVGASPRISVRQDAGAHYLALGDSYTIGEAVDPADRYPSRVTGLLKLDHIDCLDPEIIATTGWTTGDLLGALMHKPPAPAYSVVSLLIGVNNQYRGLSYDQYREQFTLLLERSVRLTGGRSSHVVVLSIPDYSVTPFAKGLDTNRIASEIDSFNEINAEVAQRFGVHYVDITGEGRKAGRDATLVAGDGLHFSGKEYAIWAERMEPLMKTILEDHYH